MSKMIQVRDVPDELHNTLKARAAREGMSLSDFLKREMQLMAERPSVQEWLDLIQHIKPVAWKQSAAEIIREMRDTR